MISDVGDRVTSRQRVVRRGRFGLRGTREENTSSLNKRGCLMLRVEPGRTHGRAGAFPGQAVCASDASQQLDAQRRVRAPGRAGHPGMGALGRAAPRGHVGRGRAGTRKQRPVPEEREPFITRPCARLHSDVGQCGHPGRVRWAPLGAYESVQVSGARALSSERLRWPLGRRSAFLGDCSPPPTCYVTIEEPVGE